MSQCSSKQKKALIEDFAKIGAMPIRKKVILETKKAEPAQKAIMQALGKLFDEADNHKHRLHETDCVDIDVGNEEHVAQALQQMIDAFSLTL